ncbi:AsnC family transcriptional regulator [Amylibacter ulvae]|uniref:AsnC family transcriptional regulator n=1 Tax=Paramylibacter ulvae TaxID=1651968 RepID=A0ABQ3D4Z8_9RHOB|nr:Lrp/AsnC ligand binding domain-containing protein [Amylibacter ulvae]GHA55845.1 AsnC family transcriptional regulator [Amylibacter ulvae]
MDRKILDILQSDGRISVTALASRVGLSKTPCQTRVQKLIKDGIIQGFRAVVSPKFLGRAHIAFVEVTLSDTREKALGSFNDAVRSVAEIEECHMIAGSFDYLLKIRSRDIADYRAILGEVITALPYVANTSTHVVMEPVKDQADIAP